MKKIISIILCLAMIFVMAATVFGATALGNFSVIKTDSEGAPLEGAEFILIPADANEAAYSAISDVNGTATFTNVSDGTYILKENTSPNGYVKSEDTYSIYVVYGEVYSGYQADDAGSTRPIPYAPVTFVNEKIIEETDPITVYIPFIKVVEQTGFKAPGAETFKFEVYDFRYQGEVTIVSDTIETNGVGTYEDYIVIEVETEDVISEGFLIKEVKGAKDGWTYSEAVYDVEPVFDDNQGWTGEFTYTIEENGDPVTYDEMTFVNSYYKAFVPAPSNPAPSVSEETEENPDTGAPVIFAIPAIIAAAGVVAVIGKRK